MSRIGKQPVPVPETATVQVSGRTVRVKGPKGELTLEVHPATSVRLDDANQQVVLERKGDDKQSRALHGTMRALVQNMMKGVTEGFSRQLEIVGVGYQARLQGRDLVVLVGFSHPVVMPPPEGVTVEVPAPTQVVVSGPDKQAVNEYAANVRRVRPPEPYKGKGIRYRGEVIKRKAGKAFVSAE